jgi:hypothetical protein
MTVILNHSEFIPIVAQHLPVASSQWIATVAGTRATSSAQ